MADISGYLQNIRNGARGEDVRDSIINALDKINKDNPAVIRPLNVTANGTYAGEGGIVYNPVTVNVPEGASQALSLTDLKITENGEYDPDDGEAYKRITVEVPTYVNEIMEEEKVIYLEEGEKTYYALDDGYDGYGTVHVMSGSGGSGGGATYSVRFMSSDGGTLLEEVTNVPFGGGAVYHKPLPTSPGMRFVGWNPNPLKVTANMECRAKFENQTYDENQILDDWITIAKKCQADPNAYNIGQWKLLELNPLPPVEQWDATTTAAFQDTPSPGSGWIRGGMQLKMVLAAKGVDPLEGENGYANTTWVAYNSCGFNSVTGYAVNLYGLGLGTNDPGAQWKDCALNNFLKGQFTTNVFPQALLPYIKRVIKKTTSWNTQGQLNRAVPSVDWFFIPSQRELVGNIIQTMPTNMPYWGDPQTTNETEGPIYDIFGLDTEDYFTSYPKRLCPDLSGSGYNAYYLRTRTQSIWNNISGVYQLGTVGGSTPEQFGYGDVQLSANVRTSGFVRLCFCI